jgi:uncharacterized protein (TIGR02246 family)
MNGLRVLLLSLLVAPSLFAAPAEDPVHNALRALKATMTRALNERDIDTIVANVDKDVVFTTMNGDVCRGPGQIRAYFNKMLKDPGHVVKDVKVSFEADALTTLYGGDTGVASGFSNDRYHLVDGETFDIHGRWSCTLVKQGDRWVIASFHYSANVFDNPVLNRLKTMAILAGGVGLLVGLIVGVAGMRIAGRRS